MVLEPCLETLEGFCEPCCDILKHCFGSIRSFFGYQRPAKNGRKYTKTKEERSQTTKLSQWRAKFSPQQNQKKPKKRLKKPRKNRPGPSASPIIFQPRTNPTSEPTLLTRDQQTIIQQLHGQDLRQVCQKGEERSIQSLTPEPSAGTKQEDKSAKILSDVSSHQDKYYTTPYSSYTLSTTSLTSSKDQVFESSPHHVNFSYPSKNFTKDQLWIGNKNFGFTPFSNSDGDFLSEEESSPIWNKSLGDTSANFRHSELKQSANNVLRAVVHSFLLSESTETSENEDL